MSDLQCPAIVLLVDPRIIVSYGVSALVGSRRLLSVFVVPAVADDPYERIAARDLADEGHCDLENLVDVVDGKSLAEALGALADLHRGETIAVVATRSMLDDMFGVTRAPDVPLVVEVDSDGMSVRSK